MAVVTATLDANDETCGPLKLQPGEEADFEAVITGTASVSLQRKLPGGSTFVTALKPNGEDAATFAVTTNGFTFKGPGIYQLIASGVSGGGTAVCRLQSYMRIAGF